MENTTENIIFLSDDPLRITHNQKLSKWKKYIIRIINSLDFCYFVISDTSCLYATSNRFISGKTNLFPSNCLLKNFILFLYNLKKKKYFPFLMSPILKCFCCQIGTVCPMCHY